MTIRVESTTDSPEAVTAAVGGMAGEDVEVQAKSEAAESSSADESTDESDPSEKESEAEDESEESEESSKEDSDDEDESEAEDEEEGDEKPKKKRSSSSKRISKLANKLTQREKELEYWKSQALKQNKGDDQQSTSEKSVEQLALESDLDPNDFDSHKDYVAALVKEGVQKALKEEKAREQEVKLLAEVEQKKIAYQQKAKEFAETHPDFNDVIEEIIDFPISSTVHDAILEIGPALAYELAKDPEEFARICSLPVTQAERAIGRIEAQIARNASKPEKQEIKKPKAPPPITPVGTKASGSVKKSIYDPNLSQREFERMREEGMR